LHRNKERRGHDDPNLPPQCGILVESVKGLAIRVVQGADREELEMLRDGETLQQRLPERQVYELSRVALGLREQIDCETNFSL